VLYLPASAASHSLRVENSHTGRWNYTQRRPRSSTASPEVCTAGSTQSATHDGRDCMNGKCACRLPSTVCATPSASYASRSGSRRQGAVHDSPGSYRQKTGRGGAHRGVHRRGAPRTARRPGGCGVRVFSYSLLSTILYNILSSYLSLSLSLKENRSIINRIEYR